MHMRYNGNENYGALKFNENEVQLCFTKIHYFSPNKINHKLSLKVGGYRLSIRYY